MTTQKTNSDLGKYTELVNSLNSSIILIRQFENETEYVSAIKVASIKRFRHCFDVAWKVSMNKLAIQVNAPYVAICEMEKNKLIENKETWLNFLEARNKVSLAYDNMILEEIYDNVILALPDFINLKKRLET